MKKLILAFLFLTGCAHGPTLSYRIGEGFSETQIRAIHTAAGKWNAIANESHQISIEDCASNVIEFRSSLLNGADGGWGKLSGDIHILAGVDDARFEHLILHEMGHGLGLCLEEHLPAPAVMDEHASVLEFTEKDLEACRHVGAC